MATRERTLEEKLAGFADRWKNYQSTELAGAQMFLRELMECYGIWYHEPGTVFEQHPVDPVELRQDTMFGDSPVKSRGGRAGQQRMDLYIPKVVVWEMKGPKEKDLQLHHDQLLIYWARRRPRFMVLCNFHEFWIYDTDSEGGQNTPAIRFPLAELPANATALNFLGGEETYFAKASAEVTREAAQYIGTFLRDLILQSKHPEVDRPRFTKFTLECVFAMFAEDVSPPILSGKPFTNAMKSAQLSGDLSPVYNLFDDLGRVNDADRSNVVPYVNGPLFDREHPKFEVARELLANLHIAAANYSWQAMRPEVFGSIFERALLADERHSAGAHFTAEADIMKVVGPTIVRPWRERIQTCVTHKDVEKLAERMKLYHVLDPACGSGNFLYVAYRELKRLEAALRAKHTELYRKVARNMADRIPPPAGPYFSIQQLHGIDKLPEAVQLTRVVLWIAQYLANQELGLGEITLPLSPLEENVIEADALFTDWFPREEDDERELAVASNPPFMGRAKLRLALGDEYIDRLHKAYPNNRNADFVTYWYTQALKTLRNGERAGYVSSNSIAQNESREASLDRIVAAGGTIYDAWKSYDWPGEAAVHVSIVNWVQGEYGGARYLNGLETMSIGQGLSDSVDVSGALLIAENRGLCFEGVQPGNKEFIISSEVRNRLTAKDLKNAEVIRPYLVGLDVNREVDQMPSRFAIDFANMAEAEAQNYKAAYFYVRQHVYPAKVSDSDRKTTGEKARWWQFKRPAPDMRAALINLSQFLVTPVTGPHVLLHMVGKGVIVDHALKAIALDSDYHFGILQSAIHEYWAWARGSTLEERLRYTNTTIFETFPFPLLPDGSYDPRVVPKTASAKQVAKVAEKLYAKRQAACLALNLGLTKLYNYIKGKTPLDVLDAKHRKLVEELIALHAQLNAAVCACYGWPEETWRDENEVLSRLLELNQQLA